MIFEWFIMLLLASKINVSGDVKQDLIKVLVTAM